MKTITKLACRTIGTASMCYALYDAWRVGNHFSKAESQVQQSKYIEDAYFNTRNVDTVSFSDNAVSKKAFELRSKNPLPSLFGRIKGGVQGFLSSLGSNLFYVACSAMALLSKGALAKIGAIGIGLGACYSIARNCFGLGKQNPMN